MFVSDEVANARLYRIKRINDQEPKKFSFFTYNNVYYFHLKDKENFLILSLRSLLKFNNEDWMD